LSSVKILIVKSFRSLGENLDQYFDFYRSENEEKKHLSKSAPFFVSFFWTSKKMKINKVRRGYL
jgi:hypothetical protein